MLKTRIREQRLALEMKQEELGEKLGVSKQTVSHWETGSRKPDIDILIQMADIFNVSLDYLVGRC